MDRAVDYRTYAVLFVDDEQDMLETFSINYDRSFRVLTAASGAEALTIVEREPVAVLVTDQRMPGMHGLELIQRTLERRPDVVPIVLTGYTDAEALVEAINLRRIFRYVAKPWDSQDLRHTVERAIDTYERESRIARLTEELRRANERLTAENAFLREAVAVPHRLVGESGALRTVLSSIAKVAPARTTVLIEGETGTGKELVARAIHDASPRRAAMFVPVNCAALSAGVLESELFGHVKGAFTGAHADRKGLFEVADGGTIFLDEISETTGEVQANLLRVLQEGEIRRVGDNRVRTVDVRVIAATNRRLDERVAEGKFRQDLLFRLRVFPIRVPPLRERPEDVRPLLDHFLRLHCADLKRPVPRVAPEAVLALQRLAFPGNVRELGNLVERALINASAGETITEAHLLDVRPEPESEAVEAAGAATLPAELARRERACIEEALALTGGNKTHAAERLGVTYRGLLKKMKRLGMAVGDGADPA